ncbi:Ig-like domain repeat protein [Tundrisphaera sp. TA3]|uniref:NHL domain-containing protein n=1 Tax=Tundrisphaera sp. TA3 TaxID=3435775 RepID=UPI003EB817CF
MMELSTRRRPRTARRASIAAILENLESRVVMSATPTAMALQASNPLVGLGQSLTLNAIVLGRDTNIPVTGGSVTIRDGSAVLGTVPVVDGQASLTTTSLAIGTHRFSATYSGGGDYLASRTEVRPNSPVRTIAGGGAAGYAGDGGLATSALLNHPSDVAVDAAGNVYIADTSNRFVRKVGPDGIISTVAGNGTSFDISIPGSGGDGRPATAAPINYPLSVAVDAAGNLFLSDGEVSVRKVGPDGIISTVAGNGRAGFSGDGGPATSAQLNAPQGVAVDAAGNLYFTEYWNNIVRRVSADGIISTIAGIPTTTPGTLGEVGYTGDGGPATAALVARPFAVAADAAGNVYIADTGNRVVRKIGPDGIISTVAGNGAPPSPVPILYYEGIDGMPATSVELTKITGVEVDASGTIYFADSGDQAIRRVSPDGTLSTIATAWSITDGGGRRSDQFQLIRGMAQDAIGNLYFADTSANAVRMVSATTDVTVTPSATTARLSTSATSLYAGRELMLTAYVTSVAGVVDEGTATFRDGSTVLGTVAVVNGSASLAVSTLGIGSHQLSVSYDGGSRFLPDRQGVDAASDFNTVRINLPGLAGSIDALTIGGAPREMVADAAGNIYFIAGGGLSVGRITPGGVITRIAGTGAPGNSGDGGPAIDARFNDLRDLAVDAAGNLYLADPGNGAIRKVSPDGIIRTIVGNGIALTPASPSTLPIDFIGHFVLDPAGNLYIQNALYGYINRLSPDGIYSDYAGTMHPGGPGDGVPATSSHLDSGADLAMDVAGNLYIAGTTIAGSGNALIRRVSPDGIITTVAGAFGNGTTADGVPATSAKLNRPSRPTVDAWGNLYFTDDDGATIRRVSPDGIISTVARFSRTPGGYGSGVLAPFGPAHSLAVGAMGDLLVSEGDQFAVRRFSATSRVDVTPAPAGFRITATETSVLAGLVQTYTVTAVDAAGNRLTDFGGRLTIHSTSGNIRYENTVDLFGGVGTFLAGLTTAGDQRIIVSDLSGLSDPILTGEIVINVRANQVAKYDIAVEPGIAGRPLRAVVTAQDLFGNRVFDYTWPIRFFSSDPAAVLPADAELVQGRGEFTIVLPTAGTQTVGVLDGLDSSLASVVGVQSAPDPDAFDQSPDATFVRSLYRNVLGRAGSDFEVGNWVGGLLNGMTRQDVSSAFVRSIEHRANQVKGYYWDYLNRAVDPGAQHWVDALLAGASESSVIAGILSSEEYLSARQDDAEFIHNLYGDVLRRSADDVGMADKKAALAAGASRASLVAGIVAAPETIDLVLDDLYRYYLGRRRDPSSAVWEGILADPDGSAAEVQEGILASDEFYGVSGKIPILGPPSH